MKMTAVTETIIEKLAQLRQLHLSSLDMARYLFSAFALKQISLSVQELKLVGIERHHIVVQLDGHTWLDCGADNAAQAVLQLLCSNDIENHVATYDIAPLTESQLQFMLMETAHFDHCY